MLIVYLNIFRYWEKRLSKIEDADILYKSIAAIQEKIKSYSDFPPELLRPIDRKIRLAQSGTTD